MALHLTGVAALQITPKAETMHGPLSTESAGWADGNSRVTPTCSPPPVDGPKPDEEQGSKH